jgi:hypothetical protein
VLDSCGISGTGETPPARSDREAHRTPRGKRAPGTEINNFQEPAKTTKKKHTDSASVCFSFSIADILLLIAETGRCFQDGCAERGQILIHQVLNRLVYKSYRRLQESYNRV